MCSLQCTSGADSQVIVSTLGACVAGTSRTNARAFAYSVAISAATRHSSSIVGSGFSAGFGGSGSGAGGISSVFVFVSDGSAASFLAVRLCRGGAGERARDLGLRTHGHFRCALLRALQGFGQRDGRMCAV